MVGLLLQKDQRLTAFTLEKDGRGHCYVICDTQSGSVVLCAQRLPAATEFLNQHVCPHDIVSVASMYEAAHFNRKVHRRFRVTKTTLDDAPRAFAEARGQYPEAKHIVLTYRHRVTVE